MTDINKESVENANLHEGMVVIVVLLRLVIRVVLIFTTADAPVVDICSGNVTFSDGGHNVSWVINGDTATFTVTSSTPSNTWAGLGFSFDQLMV